MNASMHVYSSYMGGVATRIPGAGQSACEGCPPAAMTRPMQTCTQGHRSRAQTVKALGQSMYGSSTSVIGKAISSWILTSSRTRRRGTSSFSVSHGAQKHLSRESCTRSRFKTPYILGRYMRKHHFNHPSTRANSHGRCVCNKDKFLPLLHQYCTIIQESNT